MRTKLRIITATIIITLILPLMIGQGCPSTPADPIDTADLSDKENTAISYAAKSAGGLSNGAFTTQASTGDLVNGSSQSVASDITFGTCPTVTKTGSLLDSEPLTLTVDFGQESCTALVSQDGTYTLVVSGSATGTFDRPNKTINLQFNNLTCNDESLDGSANIVYNLGTSIGLTGSWDLTWVANGFATSTDGNGTCSYDTVNWITTISTFTGSVADSTGWSFNVEMTNVKVAVLIYGSFIPFEGSMTVSGSDIRTMTLTFNENSPTTGEVQVSIAGGRTFTVSLEDLDAALAALEAI